jgi:hypothetical protein
MLVSTHATYRQSAAALSAKMAHGAEGSCILIHNLLTTTSMELPSAPLVTKLCTIISSTYRQGVRSWKFHHRRLCGKRSVLPRPEYQLIFSVQYIHASSSTVYDRWLNCTTGQVITIRIGSTFRSLYYRVALYWSHPCFVPLLEQLVIQVITLHIGSKSRSLWYIFVLVPPMLCSTFRTVDHTGNNPSYRL